MWFAFEIYIFGILIQHGIRWRWSSFSCDLLSKFISLVFWYNILRFWYIYRAVVICFRNLYLWYSDTTSGSKVRYVALLWFAFEIYIFGILIQQILIKSLRSAGCDLLSKFISLVFWYNTINSTTKHSKLWFAFEIYIFGILIQLMIFLTNY